MQLIPNSWGSLREENPCHNPGGSPAGGEFCGRPLAAAQVVRPGQPFDIMAAVRAGGNVGYEHLRRFLFNPDTRELVLGVANPADQDVRDEYTHAEAFELAMNPNPLRLVSGSSTSGTLRSDALARRYDQFRVHGLIMADNQRGGPAGGHGVLEVLVSRTAGEKYTDSEQRSVDEQDMIYELATRLVAMGAPKETRWAVGFLQRDTTLGKVHPELFRTRRVKKAA